MGKEAIVTGKIKRQVTDDKYIHISTIAKNDSIKEWCMASYEIFKGLILPDGKIDVLIRDWPNETILSYTGCKNEGNKYSDLLYTLKSEGVIPSRAQVSFYQYYTEFYKEAVDPDKEFYSSGDKVVMVLNESKQSIKKQIKKSKRSSTLC